MNSKIQISLLTLIFQIINGGIAKSAEAPVFDPKMNIKTSNINLWQPTRMTISQATTEQPRRDVRPSEYPVPNNPGENTFRTAPSRMPNSLVIPQGKSSDTFGRLDSQPNDLTGWIYHLQPKTRQLPDLDLMQPVGRIYLSRIDIPPTSFSKGFPGVSDRFEWFAISYKGKIWSPVERQIFFMMSSDDGSKLYINGELVINNDGIHGFSRAGGTTTLHKGENTIRLDYFQGPRYQVGLRLSYKFQSQMPRIFDTGDFAQSVPGSNSNIP